jgi:hypothetical protein
VLPLLLLAPRFPWPWGIPGTCVVVSPNYGGKEDKNTSLGTPFAGAYLQSRPDIAGGAT